MYERASQIGPAGELPRYQAPSAQAGGIDIADLAGILWRRKAWIVLFAILGLGAAFVVGRAIPPYYTAYTQILIDPVDIRIVDNVLRAPNQYTDSQIAEIESQVRVIVSDNVLARVVETERLFEDEEFIGGGGTGITAVLKAIPALFGLSRATEPGAVEQGPGRPADGVLSRFRALVSMVGLDRAEETDDASPRLRALRILAQHSWADRTERTYVVNVGVQTQSRAKSVRLADAIVAAFLAEQEVARREVAQTAVSSLEDQLNALRQSVIEAEQQVEAFKRDNGIVSASGELVNEAQLSDASSQLTAARARTAEAQARYDQLVQLRARGADSGVTEAIQSPTISALRAQYAEILRREGELSATLGPRHPQMAEIGAQAANLRLLIEEELDRIASAALADLDRARASQTAVEQRFASLRDNVAGTNEASVRLRELERDVEASRSVYEAFLRRTREVTEQEGLNTSNIRIISPAQQPENRSSPPRTLYLMAAGAIAGGGLGAVLALAFDLTARLRRRRVAAA